MKKDFEKYLEEQIILFFKNNTNKKDHVEKKYDYEDAIKINIFEEKNGEKSTKGMIRLYVNDEYKQIRITNILFKETLARKGLGKQLIEQIYKIGKKNEYRTFLVNMVPSFFNRMRRRDARVIDGETVEIIERTDLKTNKTGPRAFSEEIEILKNVKEEFKPLNIPNGFVERIEWALNKAEIILKDIETDENYQKYENKKKILIPIIDYKYILNIYFDKTDCISCDKEFSEQFCFVVGPKNKDISLLNDIGATLVINETLKPSQIFCTLTLSDYLDYESIIFTDLNNLKNEMSKKLSPFLLNALSIAKEKKKLNFLINPIK